MNIFSISGLIIGITSVFLGFFVLLKSKGDRAKKVWAIFCFSVAVWGFGGLKISLITDQLQALFWWRMTYIGIIFIPILFYQFVHLFLELQKRKILYLFYFFGLLFLILEWTPWAYLFFGLNNISLLFDSLYWVYPPTPLFIYFILFWFFIIIYSHFELYKALKKSSGLKQMQIKYFFLGMVIAFAGGSTCFLPCFGIQLYPVLNIAIPLYVIIITYAILKYRLMDIKLITTQVFSTAIVLVTSIETFNAFNTGSLENFIVKVSIFITTLIFATLLIRSVLKEVRRREEMEKLAFELSKTGKKLHKANKQLKKLDEAKSEFISIASHQLRTPLTAIKGYGSMLLEGDFGEIKEEKQRDAIKKMFISNDRLITLVENLLNISRIESGRLKFDFEPMQLDVLVKDTCDNLQKVAKERGLYLNFKTIGKIPIVKADDEKIRQVVINFIDNAIKYTKKGGIDVTVSLANGKATCCVQDTGMGVKKEVKSQLFKKFSRGKGAFLVNTEGTGLGLYVAHMMIDAHQGGIWVESDGDGKGSKFCFDLPIGKLNAT